MLEKSRIDEDFYMGRIHIDFYMATWGSNCFFALIMISDDQNFTHAVPILLVPECQATLQILMGI